MNRTEKMDYLINHLVPDIQLPYTEIEKWEMLRAIFNVRQPGLENEAFLKIQDEFLQEEIARKGITDVNDLKPIHKNIYLWKGDITTLKIEAIVNAANEDMLGCFYPNHGCIDNAIHTYAGLQLRNECSIIMQQQNQSEAIGMAKLTSAYNLPAKYVIHTVGPMVQGELTAQHATDLENCYRSCLQIASENDIRSIAFCCISTGEYHFPNDKAANIAIATVSDFLQSNMQIEKIVFNVFTQVDYLIYLQKLSINNLITNH